MVSGTYFNPGAIASGCVTAATTATKESSVYSNSFYLDFVAPIADTSSITGYDMTWNQVPCKAEKP